MKSYAFLIIFQNNYLEGYLNPLLNINVSNRTFSNTVVHACFCQVTVDVKILKCTVSREMRYFNCLQRKTVFVDAIRQRELQIHCLMAYISKNLAPNFNISLARTISIKLIIHIRIFRFICNGLGSCSRFVASKALE